MVAVLQMPVSDGCVDERLERRVFPRKAMQGDVAGHRLDHSLPARRQPRLNLSMRDISYGGLAAVSDSPLAVGERISVTFPSRPDQPAWDALGRVLRCSATALGWRIAVEFEPLPAA